MVPLLSMKEEPRMEPSLGLIFPQFAFCVKVCSAKGETSAFWKPGLTKPKLRGQTCATVNRFHTLEGSVPTVDVRPSTSSTLAFFRDLPALSVLPNCTWCFPSLVPNCLVSWIFYCNFLCLIYFKVAKCFHKERAVKLFRNEEDSKTSVSFVSVLGSAW